jgi:hypothetical protein
MCVCEDEFDFVQPWFLTCGKQCWIDQDGCSWMQSDVQQNVCLESTLFVQSFFDCSFLFHNWSYEGSWDFNFLSYFGISCIRCFLNIVRSLFVVDLWCCLVGVDVLGDWFLINLSSCFLKTLSTKPLSYPFLLAIS